MAIDEATMSNLKDRLEREQKSVRHDVDQIDEEVQVLTRDDAEEGGVPTNHMADNGSDVYERERLLTVQVELGERLELIEAALVRMSSGAYGPCERCGRQISIERLSALPFARYCIECQELVEDGQHADSAER